MRHKRYVRLHPLGSAGMSGFSGSTISAGLTSGTVRRKPLSSHGLLQRLAVPALVILWVVVT